MTKPYLLLAALLIYLNVQAQSNHNQLGVSAGMSFANSKSVNVFYDWQIKGKNYLGVFGSACFYNEKTSPLSLRSTERFYFVGLQYKPLISASRNFAHYGIIGGGVSLNKKIFDYYPMAGLEQVFYTGPVTRLFVSEELNYLFKQQNHWQPYLKAGIKFSIH